MNYRYNIFLMLITSMLVNFFCFARVRKKTKTTDRQLTVHKLVPSHTIDVAHNNARWVITCDGGFVLTGQDTKQYWLRASRLLTIALRNDVLFVNGKRMRYNTVFIRPISGNLKIYNKSIDALLVKKNNSNVCMYALENVQKVFPKIKEWQKHIAWSPDTSFKDKAIAEKKLDQLEILATNTTEQVTPKAKELNVRVLLDEQEHDTRYVWKLGAAEGFYLWDPAKPRKKIKSKTKELTITCKRGNLYLNGKRWTRSQMLIKSTQDTVTFAGNTYKGLMWVCKAGEKVMLINCLEIEDYVFCVLRTESWPGWPLEINKVMAIASRTYVVSMVLNAKKSQRPYHVKNTNEHQTYAGVHDCPIIKKAVDHTKGIFLTHENQPIVAMFDSCCGGIIPAHIQGVNFNDAPYLAREYACTHCKRCSVYSWEARYAQHEIEQLLRQQVKQFKQLQYVKITKKDKAGVVQEAIVKGKNKTIKFTGKTLYSLLKDVRSFSFSVQKKSDTLIFKGRGLGHHLGLCQWGAREMVRDGWGYKRILQFYYPKTDFMRLT